MQIMKINFQNCDFSKIQELHDYMLNISNHMMLDTNPMDDKDNKKNNTS